jgi:uncharacterized protein YabE (DUF348 family)
MKTRFLRGSLFVAVLGVVSGVSTATFSDPRPLVVIDQGVTLPIARNGDTVAATLIDAGIGLQSDDVITPPLNTPLQVTDRIYIRRPRTVRLRVSTDPERSVRTLETTTAAILSEAGVPVSPVDRLEPPASAVIAEGDIIRITRVAEETRTEEEELPQETIVRSDASLPLGEETVVERGSPGRVRLTVHIRTENGRVVERTVQKREEITAATSRIVRRGTKVVVVGSEAGRASWYRTGEGTVAHRTLPFGTRIRVVRIDTGASTIARVADRGPFIAGRVVDLSTDVFRRLAPLGMGTISVRVEHLK